LDRDYFESPDSLESVGSLRSSLTAFAAVLASPAFLQRVAPFQSSPLAGKR